MIKLNPTVASTLTTLIDRNYTFDIAASTTGGIPESMKVALGIAKDKNYFNRGTGFLESNPDAAEVNFKTDGCSFHFARDGPYMAQINDGEYKLAMAGLKKLFK